MPASAAKCARIAAALGDLAGQESASLLQEDFAAVLTIQERAEPLIAFLAEHLPRLDDGAASGVRSELAGIFERRSRTAAALEEKLATLRGAMAETAAARGRAARVAPVYGSRRGAPAPRQLLAQG
jgi:hypothetical protein